MFLELYIPLEIYITCKNVGIKMIFKSYVIMQLDDIYVLFRVLTSLIKMGGPSSAENWAPNCLSKEFSMLNV
jgi:hypothetical protein